MSSKKNVVVRGGEVKVYATNFSKPHPTMEGKRGKREAMDKVTSINYDLSKNGKKTYSIQGVAKNKKADGELAGMSVRVSEENAIKVADMLGLKITKSNKSSSKPKPVRKTMTRSEKKSHCKKVGEEAKKKCLEEKRIKKKSSHNGNGLSNGHKKSSSKKGPGRPKKNSK